MRGEVHFLGQCNFRPHGRYMCTTACLHCSVAFLADHLNCGGDLLEDRLNNLMSASNKCHNQPGMVSVVEALDGFKVETLGMAMRELIFVPNSPATKDDEDLLQSMQDLPTKMLERSRDLPTSAIITGNGHTVCLMHSPEQHFSFFDPFPAMLITGLHDKKKVMSYVLGALRMHRQDADQLDVTVLYRPHHPKQEPACRGAPSHSR